MTERECFYFMFGMIVGATILLSVLNVMGHLVYGFDFW